MPVARSTKEVFDYVTLADRELAKEKQTTFHLRRLSTQLILRARSLDDHSKMVEFALRCGVAGWENFADADGAPVKASHDKGEQLVFGVAVRDPLSSESLNRLPPDVVVELAKAIVEGNTLTEDDAKNS